MKNEKIIFWRVLSARFLGMGAYLQKNADLSEKELRLRQRLANNFKINLHPLPNVIPNVSAE